MPNRWDGVGIDVAHEIVREGEAYLQGQLTLATSADQRASVIGGIYVAAGTAIIAGLVAGLSGPGAPADVVAGALVSATMFLIGAALCIWTALPVDFFLPGTQPESWYEDVEKGRDLAQALGEQAENYQRELERNRCTLRANANKFLIGAITGIAAPIAGLIAWLVVA